jgi:hypothetical protein
MPFALPQRWPLDALDAQSRWLECLRAAMRLRCVRCGLARWLGRERAGNNRRKIREINLLLGNYSAVREKGYRKSIAESA